jgi:Xaa-Pro aminopeptidase
MDATARQTLVQRKTAGRAILSDRPAGSERPLPEELLRRRLILAPSEQARYRDVCRRANDAIDEVLLAVRPDWNACRLAGAISAALLARCLQPALVLAGGEQRMAQYCHPAPTQDKLGSVAILEICARGFGLYAHLARTIHFAPLSEAQKSLQRRLHRIERIALDAAQPGANLQDIYRVLAAAYSENGHPQALYEKPQGGLAGYQINTLTISPTANVILCAGMALTLHPFLPGAQTGDTYLIRDQAPPENLMQHGEPSHAPIGMQALAQVQA